MFKKRQVRETTTFGLFFSGEFLLADKTFRELPDSAATEDDLYYAFASRVATGASRSDIVARLPRPVRRSQFDGELRSQLIAELADGSGKTLVSNPRTLSKSLFCAAIGLEKGKRVFVETGTFIGQSISRISALFDELYTVEASAFLHKASLTLFEEQSLGNIHAYFGNSTDFLAQLEDKVFEDAVFFLDAHYSTGITSSEWGVCPVVEELQLILNRNPSAVIVVDDVRTFNGRNGYPGLVELLESIPQSVSCQIVFDQLVIGVSGILDVVPGLKLGRPFNAN
jgi:predicted O-methyltransferase YrrM